MKLPRSEKVRIETRPSGIYVIWDDCLGGGYRVFGNMELAQKFASGETIEFKAPQKSRKVNISGTSEKPAQFETWAERPTREEVTTEKIIGYHFGFEGKELAAVETCFYGKWPSHKIFVPPGTIMVEVPAGTKVTWYDDEFRVVLDDTMKAYKLRSTWLKERS